MSRSLSLMFLWALLAAARPSGARSKRHKYDRFWKTRKRECERDVCGHMIPEEAYNCVNECTSTTCYNEVYSAEPLEDGTLSRIMWGTSAPRSHVFVLYSAARFAGEIDLERSRVYTACLRREARDQRRNTMNRNPRSGDGGGRTSERDEDRGEEEEEDEDAQDAAEELLQEAASVDAL